MLTDDNDDQKRRRADDSGRVVMQERNSGLQSPAGNEETEVGNVVDGDPRKWQRSEKGDGTLGTS